MESMHSEMHSKTNGAAERIDVSKYYAGRFIPSATRIAISYIAPQSLPSIGPV